MVKREIVAKVLKQTEKEREKEIAELKAELADLREAVKGLVASKPKELWNIEEAGEALKPSGVVCLARKKFDLKFKAERHDCGNCQSAGQCSNECHCEDSPVLCDACLGFLFQALNFMASQKEIDMFSFHGEILIGIHIG